MHQFLAFLKGRADDQNFNWPKFLFSRLSFGLFTLGFLSAATGIFIWEGSNADRGIMFGILCGLMALAAWVASSNNKY